MNRVEIEKTFQELITRTREFVDGREEKFIPPVDLHEILPDFWDEWFDPILKAWTPQVRHELRKFFLDQMASAHRDVAVRYTALAVYDGLIQHLASPAWSEETAPSIKPFRGITEDQNAPLTGQLFQPNRIRISNLEFTSWTEHVDLLKDDLRSILHVVPISDMGDWRVIRWEISNECLVEDWERVFLLYQRANEVRVLSDADFHAFTGRFQFLLAFREIPFSPLQNQILGCNNFCLRRPDSALHPSNWEPVRYDSPDSPASLFLFASGLVAPTGEGETATPDPSMLSDAINGLERARKLAQLSPPHQAALARCYFSARRFRDAAAAYERLLQTQFSGDWSLLPSHVYHAVALCDTHSIFSKTAREHWKTGTHLMDYVPAQNGQAAKISLDSLLFFIKALDAELLGRLFRPLRRHFRDNKELYRQVGEELQRDSKKDPDWVFVEFVTHNRNPSIGEKSRILSACRSPTSDLFKFLKVWVDQHYPSILDQAELLQGVSKFRNEAEHEGTANEHHADMFPACRKLMQALSVGK